MASFHSCLPATCLISLPKCSQEAHITTITILKSRSTFMPLGQRSVGLAERMNEWTCGCASCEEWGKPAAVREVRSAE